MLEHDMLADFTDEPGEDDLAALRALTITPMWRHLITTVWTLRFRLTPHWTYRPSLTKGEQDRGQIQSLT